MSYTNFAAHFSVLAILIFLLGCTKSFDVKEADKIQGFYISHSGPLDDGASYPIKLTVTGQIDGKALIYITPSIHFYNSSYSMTFGPRDRGKIMYREITSKNSVIVYKPITAKKGKLTVNVKFGHE